MRLKDIYPTAHLLACSTAGEIWNTSVLDDSIVATAVYFEQTTVQVAQVALQHMGDSQAAGRQLAQFLQGEKLVHVLVISDGVQVNGSALVRGLAEHLPPNVSITGGLAGDGQRFEQTLVALDQPPRAGMVAAVGFYGDRLVVGCASAGGWTTFGPDRLVTRSSANILYELDGEPALDLYRTYLGPHAVNLPASGLLFPLALRNDDEDTGVVRTVLGIDEQAGSMTFAGDVPEGIYVRLMHATHDRLIDGAAGAATASRQAAAHVSPELAILISCTGRKLVLAQRTEEEIESVRAVLGHVTAITGFYSYGEIAPFTSSARCELHNQTMTITTFSER